MSFNTTNLTGVDTFSGLGQASADATQGLFWVMVLIAWFIIVIFRMAKKHPYEDAIMVAGFQTFIVSLGLYYMQWVQILYPLIFGIITVGVVGYKGFSKS